MWTRILLCLFWAASVLAQPSVPLRQGTPPAQGQKAPPLTLREATREDRWLGLAVRDVRWAPDGSGLYFRWKQNPETTDNPDLDPWYMASRDGSSISQVEMAQVERIPSADMHWSRDRQRAAWLSAGKVFFFDAGRPSESRTRLLFSASPARRVRISPDGQRVHFEVDQELHDFEASPDRPRTQYIDFADESGYATVEDARPKVGEPQGRSGMAVVRFDPSVDAKDVAAVEVTAPYSEECPVVIHGPYWSLEGDQALVQVLSTDHKDRWISRLDLESGKTEPIAHDHDDAWLGGPPPVAGYLESVEIWSG